MSAAVGRVFMSRSAKVQSGILTIPLMACIVLRPVVVIVMRIWGMFFLTGLRRQGSVIVLTQHH